MKTRIKELRQARGLTQDQLCAMVGMSKSYLSEIERGLKEVNGRRLEAFARAFNVRTADIIDNGGPDEIRAHVAMCQLFSCARIRHVRM